MENVTNEYMRLKNLYETELLSTINKSYDLGQKIVLKDHHLSNDQEFDILNKDWIKKNWKRIVRNANTVINSDAISVWMLSITGPELVELLQGYYEFSSSSVTALIGLVIIMRRLAQKEVEK